MPLPLGEFGQSKFGACDGVLPSHALSQLEASLVQHLRLTIIPEGQHRSSQADNSAIQPLLVSLR